MLRERCSISKVCNVWYIWQVTTTTRKVLSQWQCLTGCFNTASGQPQECRVYKWLNQANRAEAQVNSPVLCDSSLQTGWYRFGGLAGNNMPTSCVPKKRCGTHASGWVTGGLPTARYQLVNRKVCFHWGNNCCNWNRMIKVRNCGGFNVYYLSKPPACSLRYCGNRKGKSLICVCETGENISNAKRYEYRHLAVKCNKSFCYICFPHSS